MAYLTPLTEKSIERILKDFGYSSKKEFVEEAVREKLRELKKLQFFSISERIRKGLRKKGIRPEDILKEIKS
jgi:metal-responsive CopG/Arc/MetJ family transcriptional regulator